MAVLATVEVPVFAKFDGEEYEIGTFTFDIDHDRNISLAE